LRTIERVVGFAPSELGMKKAIVPLLINSVTI
jgi:hypothetical protein